MRNRAIPIIRLGDLLIVSIQIDLSDQLVAALKDDIAEALASEDVDGLVIEISGVDIFDSYIAASISAVAELARFMGVDTMVAGLDAPMAVTLVEMGMTMDNVRTALNLDMAVRELQRKSDERHQQDAELLEQLLGPEYAPGTNLDPLELEAT